ncbi:uncharacterized protein LOC129743727 isoform X5 [Uranotaenia lowii]|uniref:uncharacterized protein LOC129743727 isoform X5 n=1 Tax=Uranotaenia lowii TaxID=190385 RepID=UPI0024794ED9|nr:uncharacterized protein LOC129743727 isoform X5 [Uranotaenia lowii]
MEVAIKEEPALEIDNFVVNQSTRSNDFSNLGECSTSYASNLYDDPVQEMQRLLAEWDLEILTDRFSTHLIDASVLDYIVDVDIIDLCKDLPIRYRLVLRHKLKEKRMKSPQDENCDPNVFHESPPPKRKKAIPRVVIENERSHIRPAGTEHTATSESRKSATVPSAQSTPLVVIPGPSPAPSKPVEVRPDVYLPSSSDVSGEGSSSQLDDSSSSNHGLISAWASFSDHFLLNNENTGEDSSQTANNSVGCEGGQSNSFKMPAYFMNPLNVPGRGFTDLDERIGVSTLYQMHLESRDSDYLFVKKLMYTLWPEGFQGRSVSGRPSNNPSGRNKGLGQDGCPFPRGPCKPLEDDKVKYIKDRLRERRDLLCDDAASMMIALDKCNRLMNNIISNSLRKKIRYSCTESAE